MRSSQSSSYGKLGMSLMWIPAQTTVPPFATRAQRGGHELAGGREDDRGVELLRRRLVRRARPLAAELERERAARRRRRARTKREERGGPRARATCATMCADAPKPYRPSRSASPARRSER